MGFASGFNAGVNAISTGQRMRGDEEDRKYRNEERDRERQVRAAAAETLGKADTQQLDYQMPADATGNLDEGYMQPTTSTYSRRQAYEDYSRRIAGVDPQRSMQARGMADQEELRGIQVNSAKRQAKNEQTEDAYFDFMRQNSHLPDHDFYRAAAQFATSHVQDGRSFGIDFDQNVGYQAVMVNPDGSVARHPIPNRRALEQELAKYISPQMHRQVSGEQRYDQQHAETTRHNQAQEGVALQNARTNEAYRTDMSRYRGEELGLRRQLVEATNRWGGGGAAGGRGSGVERMPEAEKVYLNQLGQQERQLGQAFEKTDDPAERRRIQESMSKVSSQKFDILMNNGLLPEGTTRAKFMGLPDPLQAADMSMRAAKTDTEFMDSMRQVQQLYSDDPGAGQALSAMQQFYDNKWGGNSMKRQRGVQTPRSGAAYRAPGFAYDSADTPGGAAVGLRRSR